MVDKDATPTAGRRRAGRRRSMRAIDRRIMAGVRRDGQFNFCFAGDDEDGSLCMGAAVSVEVHGEDDDHLCVKFHLIVPVAGSNNRYMLNPTVERDPLPVDEILPPVGYKLAPVLGSPGFLKLAPGVVQQMTNARLEQRGHGGDGGVSDDDRAD